MKMYKDLEKKLPKAPSVPDMLGEQDMMSASVIRASTSAEDMPWVPENFEAQLKKIEEDARDKCKH